jgi:F-type H+-transporting ATPase subunit epsilon
VHFQLTIVTPQGTAYRGAAESVVLPGSEGDFGVLPSHERLLAPLRIGEVEIRSDEGELIYAAIADGFADVNGETVVVMVESCEAAADVDLARAELARDRAQQGLAALGEDAQAERFAEFEQALERARNRIAVARRNQR